MKLFITKEQLNLHYTAGKDETRSHLMGVNFDIELMECAATDGIALAFLPIEKGQIIEATGHSKFIISTKDCKEILKIMKKQKVNRVGLEIMGIDAICKITSNQTYTFKVFEYGEFPDYRSIIPRFKEKFEVALNPDLLMQLKKALGRNKKDGLKLQFDTSKSVIKIICDGQYQGVLMPMRG